MNQYQEALDELSVLERAENFKRMSQVAPLPKCDLLQELVDKETPLKPNSKEEYGAFNDIRLTNYCPNCSKQIINVWSIETYKPQYCHCCGQKLDWSD